MAQNFSCPKCGAPVQYGDDVEVVDCSFCGSRLQVPEEQVNAIRTKQAWVKAKPWVIAFVLIVFVLPTCLGLFGTLVGVGAGFLGPLIAIIVSIFTGR